MRLRKLVLAGGAICLALAGLFLLLAGREVRSQGAAGTSIWLPMLSNLTHCHSYEPNGGSPGAGPILPNSTISSMICQPGDLDFYHINAVASPLEVQLTLPNTLANHMSLWLYNEQSTPIAGDDTVSSTSSTLNHTLPANGTYLLGVYSFDNSFDAVNPYTLRLSYNAMPTVTPSRTRTRTRTITHTPTRTRTRTVTPTPLPTYVLTVSQGYNTTPSGPTTVTHGVPYPISSGSPPCGGGFRGWSVTSGSASIANPLSASTTVTLTSGNATITAMYC